MSDYISRKEFENRIKPYDTSDSMDKALYNFAHNTLICCPSADVRENIHGEWKFVQRGRFVDICCNKCNHVMCKDYAYGYQLDELDIQQVKHMAEKRNIFFCSCCGADMRGE